MKQSKYPYVQNRTKEQGTCVACNKEGEILMIEWRVDVYQGNCEFEDICSLCFEMREKEARKKEKGWYKKMEPIWRRQNRRQEAKENKVLAMIEGLGFQVKKYSNGQWAIGGLIDWWTTTGTAIERKSRKEHWFSFSNPEEIKKTLLTLTPPTL